MSSPKPSRTAATVLQGVWLTACDPATSHLVPQELAAYSRAALRALRDPSAYWLTKGWVLWIARRMEARVLPGACSHYAARKVEIARIVEEQAPKRLVVLGAGFDGLAYRFADRLESIEIDRGPTQVRKREIIASLPPRQLQFITADLGASLPDLQPKPDTLFVAEGLTMYLPEEQVRELLRWAGSYGDVIFTFMTLDHSGRPAFGGNQDEIDRFLARVGEPFLWGCDPANIEAFVESAGLRLERIVGAAHARMPKLQVSADMLPGEWIALAPSKS